MRLSKSRSLELTSPGVAQLRLRVSASESKSDLSEYNSKDVHWAGTAPVLMAKPRRKFHSLSQYHNFLYMYGGESKRGVFAELYQLDLTNNLWSLIAESTDHPPPLSRHVSSVKCGNLYLIGGQLEDGTINHSMYCFNLGTFLFFSFLWLIYSLL